MIVVKRRVSVLLILLLSIVLNTGCQSKIEKADTLLKRHTGFIDSPAVSIMVIEDGAITYQNSNGYADIDKKIPAHSDTNYRIASVSKMFTAMSALVLIDQGKLEFDQKINTILSDFPEYGEEITVRHLMNHRSGLRDYIELAPEDLDYQLVDRDVYKIIQDTDSTYSEPGTTFYYSDTGFSILALVVEEASGQSLPEFMKENIFDKAGMKNAILNVEGVSEVPNRAYGCESDGFGFKTEDQSLWSAVLGDGAVYCNLNDFYKFDQALYTDKIVSPETLEEAFRLEDYDILSEDPWSVYKAGWFLCKDGRGNVMRWHDGGTQGFTVGYFRDFERKKSLVILTNQNQYEGVCVMQREMCKYFRIQNPFKTFKFGSGE